MPSNLAPLGALPSRFRRARLLIVGCGDVGLRAVSSMKRQRVLAVTSQPERRAVLRAAGAIPLVADLDAPRSLRRLAGLANRVLHLAPPPSTGDADPRTRALARALRLQVSPLRLVYGSTTGVYGDCRGEFVDETRARQPQTARAHRRVDAEDQLRHFGRSAGAVVTLLRIPGIYAADRPNGDPKARVLLGTPVLVPEDDVFTNHIHADDLARACVAALWRGRPQRAVNVCDDTQTKMGAWFEAVARHHGLPPPPRITRTQARERLSPLQMSFLEESRRLSNLRMKRELRVRLAHAVPPWG